MGLDMYLKKRFWIGAHYKHRNVKAILTVKIGDKTLPIDASRLDSVTEQVGYWRKANAIHQWFVTHSQDGVDRNGVETSISYEKLLKLKATCLELLEKRDTELAMEKLPPQEGFFFGNADVDDWYWENLKNTIEIIEGIGPLGPETDEAEFLYQSSW